MKDLREQIIEVRWLEPGEKGDKENKDKQDYGSKPCRRNLVLTR